MCISFLVGKYTQFNRPKCVYYIYTTEKKPNKFLEQNVRQIFVKHIRNESADISKYNFDK